MAYQEIVQGREVSDIHFVHPYAKTSNHEIMHGSMIVYISTLPDYVPIKIIRTMAQESVFKGIIETAYPHLALASK